jgi:hypothetical protein
LWPVHLSRGIIERDAATQYPDKGALLAADSLQKMGYTRAISLDGGWRVLKDSGIPLE